MKESTLTLLVQQSFIVSVLLMAEPLAILGFTLTRINLWKKHKSSSYERRKEGRAFIPEVINGVVLNLEPRDCDPKRFGQWKTSVRPTILVIISTNLRSAAAIDRETHQELDCRGNSLRNG